MAATKTSPQVYTTHRQGGFCSDSESSSISSRKTFHLQLEDARLFLGLSTCKSWYTLLLSPSLLFSLLLSPNLLSPLLLFPLLHFPIFFRDFLLTHVQFLLMTYKTQHKKTIIFQRVLS